MQAGSVDARLIGPVCKPVTFTCREGLFLSQLSGGVSSSFFHVGGGGVEVMSTQPCKLSSNNSDV